MPKYTVCRFFLRMEHMHKAQVVVDILMSICQEMTDLLVVMDTDDLWTDCLECCMKCHVVWGETRENATLTTSCQRNQQAQLKTQTVSTTDQEQLQNYYNVMKELLSLKYLSFKATT